MVNLVLEHQVLANCRIIICPLAVLNMVTNKSEDSAKTVLVVSVSVVRLANIVITT